MLKKWRDKLLKRCRDLLPKKRMLEVFRNKLSIKVVIT